MSYVADGFPESKHPPGDKAEALPFSDLTSYVRGSLLPYSIIQSSHKTTMDKRRGQTLYVLIGKC